MTDRIFRNRAPRLKMSPSVQSIFNDLEARTVMKKKTVIADHTNRAFLMALRNGVIEEKNDRVTLAERMLVDREKQWFELTHTEADFFCNTLFFKREVIIEPIIPQTDGMLFCVYKDTGNWATPTYDWEDTKTIIDDRRITIEKSETGMHKVSDGVNTFQDKDLTVAVCYLSLAREEPYLVHYDLATEP